MASEATKTIKVEGMTCNACVGNVTRALKQVAGVSQAKVDLRTGIAIVTYDPFHAAMDDFREAIEEEGYTVPS